MQNHHSGRWLVETIREICDEQNIELRVLSDGWLLELQKDARIWRVLGHTFDLNSSAASSIGRDKVATYELLTTYNIAAIPHYLIRLNNPDARWNVLDWAKGVVVKPLTGMAGENIRLFYDAKKARAFMKSRMIDTWAISPLVEIVREIRLIALDNKVIFTYGKQPIVLGGLKVFNLSKGATPFSYTPTAEQIQLAQIVQKTMGLRISAIDIVELATGELKVLEVNSAISMKKYTDYAKENQQDARKVYATILKAMTSKS